MKKIKNIFGIILCFTIFLMNFSVVGLVSADNYPRINAFTENMGYETFDDAVANGWSIVKHTDKDNYMEAVIEDGNIKYNQAKYSGSATSEFDNKLTYKFPVGTVLKDDINRTRITTNQYKGVVELDITYSAYINNQAVTDGLTTSTSFYQLDIYSTNSTVVWNSRVYDNGFQNRVMGAGNNITTVSSFTPGADRTVHYVFNTDTREVTASADGVTKTATGTVTDGKMPYLSKFAFTGNKRMGLGSYVTFKNVTINVTPSFTTNEKAMFDTLPVNFVDGYVEGDIEIPVIDGVTWATSNANIIDLNGNVTAIKGQTQDVTLTATFTVDGITYNKEYDITVAPADLIVEFYTDNEITPYKSVDVKNGEKVEFVNAPTVEGYDFLGWYEKDAISAFDFNTAITEDVKLYAKYELKTYEIKFYKDGEYLTTLTAKHGYTADGEIPEVPQKENHTIVGWVIGESESVFDEETLVYDNMTVNAKYIEGIVEKCQVAFKVDGELYHSDEVYEGTTVSFPVNPVKENYTFSHWELNGSEFSASTVVNEDVELNAVFVPKKFEVNFYTDENTLWFAGEGYYNTPYGTLPDAQVISGNEFKGWKLANGEDFTSDTVITGKTEVYAKYESNIKVILDADFTKYTSLDGNFVKFDMPKSDFVTLDIDDGIKLTQVNNVLLNATGAANSTQNYLFGGYLKGIVDKNEGARSTMYVNKLVGEYEVEFTFETDVQWEKHESVSISEPYWTMETVSTTSTPGMMNGAPFTARLYYTTNQPDGSAPRARLIGINTTALGNIMFDKNATEHKYVVHFNTADYTASAWTESGSSLNGDSKWYDDASFINAFRIRGFERMGIGSFIKLKGLKITQYGVDKNSGGYKASGGLLEQLPDKLVDDPYNVTGNFDMPEISGIVWTSSNESIIGTDGTVNPWYDDMEITLTATAESGAYSYSKEYIMTVPKLSHSKVNVVSETYLSADDIANWSFNSIGNSLEVVNSVDGEGIRFEKITDSANPADTDENKVYYSYLELYHQLKSDEYSATHTNNYDGVYDLTMDIESNVTSSTPVNVEVGYKNGNAFRVTSILKFNKDSVTLTYFKDAEILDTVTVCDNALKKGKLKLRIDTNDNYLSAWIDDELIFNHLKYYDPFAGTSDYNMFSTIRVGMDYNNNKGDYIIFKSVTLDELLKKQISMVEETVLAADNLDVYAITDTPYMVTSNLKNLPEKIGDYSILWTTSSNQIDIKNGTVYFDSVEKDVCITAYIYNEDIKYPAFAKKDFNLHIRASQSASEYGEYLINSLGNITNQSSDDIRYDLNIPHVSGITWTSSDVSVIAADGKINENAVFYGSKDVTITANAGGVTKDFEFKVSPRTPKKSIYSGSLPATISVNGHNDLKVSCDLLAEFNLTGSSETGKINVLSDDEKIVASVNVEDGYVSFEYKGSDNKKYAIGNGETKNIKILIMPELGKLAFWLDGDLIADYVDCLTDSSYVEKIDVTNSHINISNFKLFADDYGFLKINMDNINYFDGIGRGILNSNVNLPTNSITGDSVAWKSHDETLLKNDGTLIVPDMHRSTVLEFVIKDVDNQNVLIKREFDIMIECDETKNLAKEALITASKLDYSSYPKTNVNDSNFDTVYRVRNADSKPTDIVFDLKEIKTFSSVYLVEDADAINDITIYISDNNSTWQTVYSGNMKNVSDGMVRFDICSARYVKVEFGLCDTSFVDINEIKILLNASAKELAQLDLDLLNVPKKVTGDIKLETTGVNGNIISWTSSDTSVISSDGKVTKPKTNCNVTLTATIQVGDNVYTRIFDVIVLSQSSSGPENISGGSGGGGSGGGKVTTSVDTDVIIGPDIEENVYAKDDAASTEKIDGIYNDVKPTDWYYNAVITLTQKGIVSGDGTGKFNPSDNVTREQFVKMILEATDTEITDSEHSFADVTKGAWYEDYVATAVEKGIVKGLSDKEFGVGTSITRQDMAVLIERVLTYKEFEIEKSDVESFADVDEVSDYAKDAVASMKAIGLIQGYNNNYNPKDNLTRAEAATVINSLLEMLNVE